MRSVNIFFAQIDKNFIESPLIIPPKYGIMMMYLYVFANIYI